MMTIRRHRSIILILLVPAVVGVLLFGGWAYGQARQVFRKLKVLQTIRRRAWFVIKLWT